MPQIFTLRSYFPLIILLFPLLFPVSLKAQPVANFTADTLQGCSPFSLLVNFQDLSTGNPTSWQWSFGDPANSTSIVQSPSFIYNGVGCYDVTLIVSNALGSDTLTQTCFIEIFPQPQPNFTASPTEGCAPLTVTLNDNSTPNAPGIASWAWTLTDGSSGTGPNPTFTFNTPDTIGVVLLVTNTNGCQNAISIPDLINVYDPPVVDFVADTTTACNPPLTVNFTNLSQTNGASNPQWNWQFPGGTVAGGGNSSTQQSPPPVTYNAPGNYPVTLIVQSANNCSDTLVRNNYIRIGGVTADFTASATTICLGETITFNSTSTGGVTGLAWNFGENPGVDATTPTATYTYADTGTYTVSLIAQNAQCGDTLIRTSYITVLPPPTADFSVDRDADCQPGNPFTFTDLSTGAASWSWDFGDGSPLSTQQNPTHTYTSFGTFTICLTVTSANGCTDTFCDDVEIQPAQAAFTPDPQEGCVPITVNFTDNSTATDSIVSWSWIFGSGNDPNVTPDSSDQQNPVATFSASGSYSVQLIIETQNGCRDTASTTLTFGTPPTADFIITRDTVCLNDTLTFKSLFTDPDWNYFWDQQYVAPGNFVMGDSTLTTVYSDTGTFSVALVVENFGCRDTLIQDDVVFVSPPRAQFTLSDSVVCTIPASVTITDETIGPADQYEWWLDNTIISTSQTPPVINIPAIGTYTVQLVVTNSISGCTDTTEQTLNVGNPIADFNTFDLFGCRPFPVNFNNTSQNAVAFNWRFDFPQAPASNAGSPTYIYPDSGLYSVRLIAIDAFGCTDTLLRPQYIEVVGPYAEFSGNPLDACPGTNVSFTDSTAVPSGTFLTTWNWNFGDPASGGNNTSTLANPAHQYNAPGSYDVTLVVQDNNGCTDTLTKPGYVNITFPIPDFTVDDDSTCAGNDLNFTSLAQGAGLTYLWDFGDGTGTSTQANPVYAYADTGAYDVKLVVVDQNGCTDSLIQTAFIYIEQFEANFGGDPLTGICPPLNVQFTDSTVGNVTGWQWDFGTGINFSNLQNPANVYFQPGSFNVQLIATHEDGCQDTLVRPNYVNLGGPVGTFTIDPPNACLGDTVCITAQIEGATQVTFDFRDGNTQTFTGLTGIADTVTACHLYVTPDTYAPVLILQDQQGCVFTPPSSDSTIIYSPPQAAFLPTDSTGCTPFSAGFIDGSIPGDSAIALWLWDFGDNSPIDSTQNPVHIFDSAGIYNVQLTVVDSNGCADTLISGPFEALQGVTANFVASDSFGCAPFNVSFTDLSTNQPPVSWNWDFGDGTAPGTNQNPAHTYLNNGVFTVTLIVNDALGCSDTLEKTDYINLNVPAASISASQFAGCNPIPITFFGGQSQSDTTIVDYEWCVENVAGGIPVCNNTAVDSFTFTFNNPGTFRMILRVTDLFGCSGPTDTVEVTITNRTTPAPIEPVAVSVLGPSSNRLLFTPYAGADFVRYTIYRSTGGGGFQPIDTLTNIAQNLYIDNDPALNTEAQSYCYKVTVTNTCDEESRIDLSAEHCTMNLVTTAQVNQIQLNWTPYVGFGVAVYEIYRVTDYDTANVIQIGVVPGNQTDFVDIETFCTDSVTYRILALGGGGPAQRSYSNISSNAALNPAPTEFSRITYATVLQDSVIEVAWDSYTGRNPVRYILEKSLTGNNWDSLAGFPVNTLQYTDPDVAVDDRSYFYRVFAVDECGDRSAEGFYGKSILLNSNLDRAGRTPQLDWSAYEQWPNAVLRYEVEIFNESTGLFELVDNVPGNRTSFSDNLTQLDQISYCYRVRAIESGQPAAEALSNETCVVFGPEVYVPNAFTPNGDGNNDFFTIVLPGVANFELIIFDQWGVEIFRSNNLDNRWDGRYKGRDVPEGVYVYRLTGNGANGASFERSGTITVIR